MSHILIVGAGPVGLAFALLFGIATADCLMWSRSLLFVNITSFSPVLLFWRRVSLNFSGSVSNTYEALRLPGSKVIGQRPIEVKRVPGAKSYRFTGPRSL